MDITKFLDNVIAWFIGTKPKRPDPSRRTRALKGALASKKGRKMSFREIREAATMAAFNRDERLSRRPFLTH